MWQIMLVSTENINTFSRKQPLSARQTYIHQFGSNIEGGEKTKTHWSLDEDCKVEEIMPDL